jgi:hypothetical protein
VGKRKIPSPHISEIYRYLVKVKLVLKVLSVGVLCFMCPKVKGLYPSVWARARKVFLSVLHLPSTLLSPGVKRPECEADHSPLTSAEVKNARICTSIPPYVFM